MPPEGLRYRFGPFTLNAKPLELARNGVAVPVQPKALELLSLLVERAGETVPKSEIVRALWGEPGSTHNNLTQHIFMLRHALGDARGRDYIVTMPREGYRFVAPVQPADWEPLKAVVSRHYCETASALLDQCSENALLSAVSLFCEALECDPQYARAYAGRARARFYLGRYGFRPHDALFSLAQQDALAALRLDPAQVSALVTDALIMMLQGQWDRAFLSIQSAVAIDASDSAARIALIEYFTAAGAWDRALVAVEEAERACDTDRPYPSFPLLRAQVAYFSGAFSAAIGDTELLCAKYPRYEAARLLLVRALAANGEFTQAAHAAELLLDRAPDGLWPGQAGVRQEAFGIGAFVNGRARGPQHAAALARRFESEFYGRPVSSVSRAFCALGLDDEEAARQHLCTAIRRRDPLGLYVRVDPLLTPFLPDRKEIP